MPSLELVSIDFVDTAPRRVVVEQTMPASATDVWAAVIDYPGWADWFPAIVMAEPTSDPATGVGSTRRAQVGPLVADEQFIAWEPEKLWTFSMIKTNLPLAKRLIEQIELQAEGTSTHVRYTGAYEPLWFNRPVAAVLDNRIQAMWTKGLAGLADHLASS